jgi:hypothetical protein
MLVIFSLSLALLIEKSAKIGYILKSAASTLSEQPPSRGIGYCILSSYHQGRPISFDRMTDVPERLE